MKKRFLYSVCIIIVTIIVQSILINYCLNNISLSINVTAKEQAYPEYSDKIMGFGGSIMNNTIFPIKVKSVAPKGTRGMEYITTSVTKWGFSEIKKDDLYDYESLENKIIQPFTEYEIGLFYEFTGEYAVNPTVIELTYSIFGKDFVINELVNTNNED